MYHCKKFKGMAPGRLTVFGDMSQIALIVGPRWPLLLPLFLLNVGVGAFSLISSKMLCFLCKAMTFRGHMPYLIIKT